MLNLAFTCYPLPPPPPPLLFETTWAVYKNKSPLKEDVKSGHAPALVCVGAWAGGAALAVVRLQQAATGGAGKKATNIDIARFIM